MSDTLKPCPFCGGKADILSGEERTTSPVMRRFYRVFCTVCQVRQPYHRSKMAYAAEAWNTRAKTQQEGHKE